MIILSLEIVKRLLLGEGRIFTTSLMVVVEIFMANYDGTISVGLKVGLLKVGVIYKEDRR